MKIFRIEYGPTVQKKTLKDILKEPVHTVLEGMVDWKKTHYNKA